MANAIVIGGGVIGSVAAYRLQQRGIATRLIDPDPEWRGASLGNAGHIAADEVHPLASRATLRNLKRNLFMRGGPVALPLRDIAAWLPFGLRLIAARKRYDAGVRPLSSLQAEALPAWRRLVASLGAPALLRDAGHFVVWDTPESAAAGRALLARTETGNTSWRNATDAELAHLAGLMKPPGGAVRFDGTGQITDLGLLAETLVARFEALGGIRLRGAARIEGDAVRLVTGERLEADTILVAAGPASSRLLRPLGHKAPLIAERGYHIQCAGAGWPEEMPSILFADRHMFVTRFRSGLRATSFVEFGRASSPPDPRKWRRLRDHVRALGLPFEEPIAEWMGARPTLPDYLPAIGRSGRMPNLCYAFGHQHLG
ncbi:MAG: NAD(P)/FAD-dependent oxidoreductase, partial [Sphingosinicella sp.]|uniref:NAD(P)/FAD-dependent oxidoreductase n=1 Tax=Sphingosinicella sp. TaxID=1917971 RepID=UPI0040376908